MAIEQLSNALRFTAFYTASGQLKTGLTVTVNVYRNSTLVITAAAATEVGDGLYIYSLASNQVTAEGVYTAVFKTADSTVDAQHIVSAWTVQVGGVENLDATVSSRLAAASYTTPPTAAAIADQVWDENALAHNTANSMGELMNRIGAVTVTISSAVADDGDTTIRQGKAYTLSYTLSDPPVAATAISFQCLALGFTKTGSYSSPTITVELTSAETALFGQGVYPFEIEATVDAATVVLVAGNLTVLKDR